jgi:ATP-dependent DNA helicase RecG
MHPEDSIEQHFRLAKDQKAALKRLGLFSIRDLLRHFPSRYESISESSRVRDLTPGTKVTLYGTFSKLEAKRLWKSKRPATQGWFEDGTGRVKVIWFNQPYIARMAPQGQMVKLSGSVAGTKSPYITNPEFEVVALDSFRPTPGSLDEIAADAKRGESGNGDAQNGMVQEPHNKIDDVISSKLLPMYPESRGVTSRWFYHAAKRILASGILKELDDSIPPDVCARYYLPKLASALVYLHTPQSSRDAEAARKRFAFEEIFVIQTAKQKDRAENDLQQALSIDVNEERVERFVGTLPFALTGAQERAVHEILSDFQKPHPMARLLEGDVGSGKTAVAAATAYAVVTSKPKGRTSGTLQVAYMAPTEILASQHFRSFIEHFKELPINIGLITGSGCYKFPSKVNRDEPTKISRAQLLKWTANGEIAMLIGTHALIQKSVQFQNLAYVIVDEQHRFGVNQRKALIRGQTRNGRGTDADNARIDPLLYRDLTYRIRAALFNVKKELGGGHKEVVYQRAVAEEFERAKLAYSREKHIPISYRGKQVGTYQPDFVVEDTIIVELKAQVFTGQTEKKQLWTYLKGSQYRLALLANFGPQELTVDRVVYDTARSSASVPHDVRVSSASIPHFLSMTATPIPRTLALTIYGDLDLSVLDELPPNRATIDTKIITPEKRNEAYEIVRREVSDGRQAYVICPRIEEPDPAKAMALRAKSAQAEAKRLKQEVFPEFTIGLMHGKLRPAQKEEVMADFANGATDILVSTSVVEVGVNVPNATCIVIEGAERFGLAQLHQLRGRVLRSHHRAYCFLLPGTKGKDSRARLSALAKTANGFELAEEDLQLRGAGDLFGRKQWGISDLAMEALKNARLIEAARKEAHDLVAADPSLANHPALLERIRELAEMLHEE